MNKLRAYFQDFRCSRPEVFCKKEKKWSEYFLENSNENTCVRVSFLMKLQPVTGLKLTNTQFIEELRLQAVELQIYQKETPTTEVFSCEFCQVTASDFCIQDQPLSQQRIPKQHPHYIHTKFYLKFNNYDLEAATGCVL